MYSASKHAVKGFTDALRMELEEEGAPVSVTLIKPSAIDTPYSQHAKNYMEVEPNPGPGLRSGSRGQCDPPGRRAAGARHHDRRRWTAAKRDGTALPRLTDIYMERSMFSSQRSDVPPESGADNLYQTRRRGARERGGYYGARHEVAAPTPSLHSHPGKALWPPGWGSPCLLVSRSRRGAATTKPY